MVRHALFQIALPHVLVVVVWASGCTGGFSPDAGEPFYSDDLGREAELPGDEGVLAGTFALKTVNTTLITIPVIEREEQGGGVNFRLVTRTWDADASLYRQESSLCGGFNYEVAGVVTSLPESTYRAVPTSTEEIVDVDHTTGTYLSTGHLQLWALQDLPDPFTTPLPATEQEATVPPHSDRIYDMDDDGELGVTTFVSGLVEGRQFIAQRKTVEIEGITIGPDYAFGLARNTNELVYLGNDNTLLDQRSEGASQPHPDPKESWFEEVRVDAGTTCDDVMAMSEDGTLSRVRPF
jgi:hypothetical protein